MLRCSGCAEIVSEYAARCPNCRRSVDDALEIPDSRDASAAASDIAYAGIEMGAPVRDLPGGSKAYSPSRAVLAALWAATLTVGALGAFLSTRPAGSAAAPALKDLDGRIVAQSPGGSVVRVDPAAGSTVPYETQGAEGQVVFLASSPDGTAWIDSAGRAVTFSGTKITAIPTSVTGQLVSSRSLAPSESFADKGQALVLLTRQALRPAFADVVMLGSGEDAALGAVDSAGGDPQTFGAFVSTPAQQRRSHSRGFAPADLDVELRQAGQPPLVLATAAQLNLDVGWLPTTPVELGVYPSPTGDAVAVVVTPLNPVDNDAPMVVLSRDGSVLSVLSDWRGPMFGSEPVWSPGGRELAYPTQTATGAALAITTETGTVEALAAPTTSTTFGNCVWAPSSNGTVCEARVHNREVWLYTTRAAKRLIVEPARGRPLAWISSSL